MTKHEKRCLELMERFAVSYEQQEAEARQKYEKAGPGSHHFDEMLRHRAVAYAYRNCIQMLSDPKYFEIK